MILRHKKTYYISSFEVYQFYNKADNLTMNDVEASIKKLIGIKHNHLSVYYNQIKDYIVVNDLT